MSNLMISFGSGGHTGEMESLIKSARIQGKIGTIIEKVICIVTEGDNLSSRKINESCGEDVQIEVLKRPRKVNQSYITSIATTLMSFIQAITIISNYKPQILLTNGPAISVTLALAIAFLRIISLGFGYKCRIVFIESFCRTKSLSLSGKIIYKLGLYHRFYVQWPDLVEIYPGVTYEGLLV